ncbi:glucoamylase family protein [Hoeflea sp. TYP-13]|uniref:GH36-type glycosyl hydrolase domain-containing protein n=1 Tax=Hoeflea sp. TYP-13 TaxID=3230023 RepID=UPI0034C5D778
MRAFQEVGALSIAELWAFPSALRLANIENLAVAFQRMSDGLAPPFVPDLFDDTSDPPDIVARAIINLSAIHAITWQDFFDQTSLVETVLKGDPADVYSRMDFDTRDAYRKVVEEVAASSTLTEPEVAKQAVELSRAHEGEKQRSHVGFWLIGQGRPELEVQTASRIYLGERIYRAIQSRRQIFYASSLLIMIVLAICVPVFHLFYVDAPAWAWGVGVLLSLLPASVLSVSVVHWAITRLIRPRLLPAFDFSKQIPNEFMTAVAVPVIVSGDTEIQQIVESLETRRLANPDRNLRYVLLTDLPDAAEERVATDQEIERKLAIAVRGLNRRYGDERGGPFYLLHRPRKFNANEGVWMGWERKRGKLEQFNSFVLGAEADDFSICEGAVDDLRNIRFVITLDADTMLPPGTAARLIGTMAHPLNQAVFDKESGHIVSGYSILQPRIEILPSVSSETPFSHLYSGDTAIDIYTHAVSDVYQDLFGTGIFVGKGIYDIAALQRCLENRVPDNAILSHDLFEGLLGRTALVTNIVLYESFPSTYAEYALRLHRWVRGDWQLLPWLARSVRSADGSRIPNPFSILDRWKIIDNLRRSLIPPALLLFFIGGWMILPGSAVVWTILAVAAPGIYLIGEVFSELARVLKRGVFGDIVHRVRENGGRWFLAITFLVNDTLIALDAVSRTLWRLFFSQRHLLEWRAAAHTAAWVSNHNRRAAAWRFMWPSSVISLVIAVDLSLFNSDALAAAAPLLILWFVAPEIAAWTGKTRQIRRERLDESQSRFLMQVARRTWHYFEVFAGPQDNWLPPDNFQEAARIETAHRTSPTNIGLYLVSALSARDFGFIGTEDFASRCRHVLETLGRMDTYRGHLLNWYDTRNLQPLEPRYVSTVDSGNLAVCLLALKQSCIEIVQEPVIDRRSWDGLECDFSLLHEAVQQLSSWNAANSEKFAEAIREHIHMARQSPEAWFPALDDLDRFWPQFEQVVGDAIKTAAAPTPELLDDIHTWLERFDHHLRTLRRNLDAYLPWLEKLREPPTAYAELAGKLGAGLGMSMPLTEAGARRTHCLEMIDEAAGKVQPDNAAADWLRELRHSVEQGLQRQDLLQSSLDEIAKTADEIAFGMNFSFLYNSEVRLFRIGYNLSSGQMDPSHYDLLATEARLASFFAIAKHDAPIEHWFFLGRPITRLRGKPSILSWNGSMFEYLMPPLFLPGKRDTLLGESESTAVEYQRNYAKERGVPWGISESAFGVTDADGNYQYRAFGAPGLGIRRGLTEDLVVSPYASALALCVWPNAAVQNLQHLRQLGALGAYGFFDALDYSPDRAPEKKGFVPVRTYMAHHQGMTIAAIANVLNADILIERVLREKQLRAIEHLLQEKIPWNLSIEQGRIDEEWNPDEQIKQLSGPVSWIPSSSATIPQMHHIGNGRMSMKISEAGGGGLNWNGMALTRWLPDPTRDRYGYWIYMRDVERDLYWSIGRRPAGDEGSEERVIFHQHMVEMLRRAFGVTVRMEITVAPSDDVEIRHMTVTNEESVERVIEFTSYAEVVLSSPQEDERHPAFSKLFVGSTFLAERSGLLFERRPRRPESDYPVLLHALVSDGAGIEVVSYESDREQFVGRNTSMRRPHGLVNGLSRSTGWTLDPVMSLQVRLRLKPLETRTFSFVTIAGKTREAVLEIANRYHTHDFTWVFEDASREYSREIGRLEIAPQKLPELQALSSLLVQACSALRNVPQTISANCQGQPDLWRFGISGDLPILLVRIGEEEDASLLDELVRAQQLWRRGGLKVDIVVLRTGDAGYEEPVRERIVSILRDAHAYGFLGRTGGIHILSASHMEQQSRNAIEAAAYVVVDQEKQALERALDSVLEQRAPPPLFDPPVPVTYKNIAQITRPGNLYFDNDYGGFDPSSGDYVVFLNPGEDTPAPWCNVLANDQFGSIVSESGLGFTWAVNSGENRLTPWSNDPVADTPGEIVYLRDEATADYWTVTPRPLGHDNACEVRHGVGYTSWMQHSHALEQEMLAFVPAGDPVKIIRLRLRNRAESPRRVTATYFAEWLLGSLGSIAKPHVTSEYDAAGHAIFANNAWSPEFASRVAFLTASVPPHSVTGDRYDFLGHEGEPSSPAAMRHLDLGGRFTPGGDTCAAYQVHLDIGAGEMAEVYFILGQGEDLEESRKLIARWQDRDFVEKALEDLKQSWATRLGSVQVETPDKAFNLMINRWLPYQALASRYFARAGFYQAGGAFGFRDQLQDVLAFLHGEPNRVRQHILDAARHQFEEGDALHWWHPPSGRGVRTRCSDDYLWLPYVTARYVEATGDKSVLDENVPFLTGPELRPDQDDHYAHFDTGESDSLYEHCIRALERMMATGEHGLPLIGAGDWNDGMDRVGSEGRGESIWLAWFQIAIIDKFAPLITSYGDPDRAKRLRGHARSLKTAIQNNAWDGAWYIRAFDDAGEPWGSDNIDECQIDSIAQSWSVLSGSAADERSVTALKSALGRLIDTKYRLAKLLDPPFHNTSRDPGYIKAYPPGVRENGGQYTHAAAWLGFAFAKLGDGDEAWRIFDIINPVRRADTKSGADRYRREPYVLPGDVSAMASNEGLGGWSWYTGAASWAWQLGVEGILGVQLSNGALKIDPSLPGNWKGARVTLKGSRGKIVLTIEDPDQTGHGVKQIKVDEKIVRGKTVRFPGKGRTRKVDVRLGR